MKPRTFRRIGVALIGLGGSLVAAGIVFFFAAIWHHGSDRVDRLSGTGALASVLGLGLCMLGAAAYDLNPDPE